MTSDRLTQVILEAVSCYEPESFSSPGRVQRSPWLPVWLGRVPADFAAGLGQCGKQLHEFADGDLAPDAEVDFDYT